MELHRNDVTDDNWKWPVPDTSTVLASRGRQSFRLKAFHRQIDILSLFHSASRFLSFCCFVRMGSAWINKAETEGGYAPDKSVEVVANGHEDMRLCQSEWKQSLICFFLFNGLLSCVVWVRLWWVYSSLYIPYIAFIPSLLKDSSTMWFQAKSTNKP